MSDRDDQKARYLAYRAEARSYAVQQDRLRQAITVPEHAAVAETEGGAFVEAVIWVPREAIDAKTR